MTAEYPRYAIVLVSPKDYPHTLALLEIAEAYLYGLIALGYDAQITTELTEPGRQSIIFGAHLAARLKLTLPADAILVNLEQMDPDSSWVDNDYLALLQQHEVWDYSARNVAFLRERGVRQIKHVPLGHMPQLSRIAPAAEQDIDVLFYGSLNDRRQKIIDALEARGLNVVHVFGVYAAERDALIARAKVVLNIHFYESKLFEIVRVAYLLGNSACVVSETGLDPMEQAFAEGLVFAEYEALVDTCVALVADPARRRQIAVRGRALMDARPQTHYLQAALRHPVNLQAMQQRPAGPARQWFLNVLPRGPMRLLVVSNDAALGAALKQQDPARSVLTLADSRAGLHADVDQHCLVEDWRALPPYPPASFDYILYDETLCRMADPLAVLRTHRQLLRPNGEILVGVPNIQHTAVLKSLMAGDFDPTLDGALAHGHVRYFSYSTLTKLLLDAGFAPQHLASAQQDDPDLAAATLPLIDALRLDRQLVHFNLSVTHHLYRGVQLHWPTQEAELPITFVACVNNDDQLHNNLLRSPCLQPGSPHELIIIRDAHSAADGLNEGIERAQHSIVVLLHQDVYLPAGWTQRLVQVLAEASDKLGHIGIAGVFGVLNDNGEKREIGHVVDRHTLRAHPPVPAVVDTLDELLLVVPKNTPLRFDPALGWHLYASDFALQARQRGLAAVAIDALCFHHTRSGFTLPDAYWASAKVFTEKWRDQLPIMTPCATFTA